MRQLAFSMAYYITFYWVSEIWLYESSDSLPDDWLDYWPEDFCESLDLFSSFYCDYGKSFLLLVNLLVIDVGEYFLLIPFSDVFISIYLLKISIFYQLPFILKFKKTLYFSIWIKKFHLEIINNHITNTPRSVEVSWNIICLLLLSLSSFPQYKIQQNFLEWDIYSQNYRVKFLKVPSVFGNDSVFSIVPVRDSLQPFPDLLHTSFGNAFQFCRWFFGIKLQSFHQFDLKLRNTFSWWFSSLDWCFRKGQLGFQVFPFFRMFYPNRCQNDCCHWLRH